MTLPNLPEVPPKPTTEQLAQIVGELVQQLSYLLSGFLSSDNAREFGGWQVGQTELQSKDKTVGMSTEKTAADDIRFWAGDLKNGSPNFAVTENGKATMKSDAGYPRVEFNSQDGSISAYQSADSYFRVSPDAFGSTPGIVMTNSLATALMYLFGSSLQLLTVTEQAQIQIASGKNLDLFCNDTGGYKTRVNSWEAILNVDNGRTLQDEVTQINTNMININSLFAYCNNLDMRLTALGG